jgi:hypothetical protein
MMLWLALLGALVGLIAAAIAYSDWSFKRERAEQRRLDDLRRKSASTADLEHALAVCDYFDLTVDGQSLRDTAAVKEFFRRLDVGEHGELLEGFDAIVTSFAHAESEIGYDGRPMISDYHVYLRDMVAELASRSPPRK